jgi:hypothetical protein
VLKICISFDYDTPIGYNESFNIKHLSFDSEVIGTEKILEILNKFNIKVTFGIVAAILNKNNKFKIFSDQIMEIHKNGHEICSHSYSHKFLPSIKINSLIDEIESSKRIIEDFLQSNVIGFIPPFNRPMTFINKGALSVAEIFGLHGRGRAKNTMGKIISLLNTADYKWIRVSFEPKIDQILRILIPKPVKLIQPFYHKSILAIPLHSTGFGRHTQSIIGENLEKDKIICIYAHPHQASNKENDQNVESLTQMLHMFENERALGLIDYIRMDEVANYI